MHCKWQHIQSISVPGHGSRVCFQTMPFHRGWGEGVPRGRNPQCSPPVIILGGFFLPSLAAPIMGPTDTTCFPPQTPSSGSLRAGPVPWGGHRRALLFRGRASLIFTLEVWGKEMTVFGRALRLCKGRECNCSFAIFLHIIYLISS